MGVDRDICEAGSQHGNLSLFNPHTDKHAHSDNIAYLLLRAQRRYMMEVKHWNDFAKKPRPRHILFVCSGDDAKRQMNWCNLCCSEALVSTRGSLARISMLCT